MSPVSRILVAGATRGFGEAVALAARGARVSVRALVRDPSRVPAALAAAGVELVQGDVRVAGDVAAAAAGCSHVIHAVNVPYQDWATVMESATANVVAATERAGAELVFPGNVYGLAPRFGVPLSESHPDGPSSRKGALRVRLEAQLRAAAAAGRCRVLIVRANDFYGPTVRNGGVDRLFRNAVLGRPMSTVTAPEVAHEMVYAPDLARATLALMALEDRLAFEVFHFAGHVTPTWRDFLVQLAELAGTPPRFRTMGPALVRLVGLFDPLVRELGELMYLHRNALLLDDAKFRARVPHFRPTPLRVALTETLASYRAALEPGQAGVFPVKPAPRT